MSNRRAAMRRERMEREKINKSKSPTAEYERAVMQGTLDGRVYGACIVLCTVKKLYKMSKKNLSKLLEASNKEAVKFNEDATMFNLQFYQDKMLDKLQKTPVKTYVDNAKEKIYVMRRNELFISSCCLMFLALKQEFGFSSNSKGTGRIDIIMEYVLNEYIKMQYDKTRDIEFYIKKTKEETGISFVD